MLIITQIYWRPGHFPGKGTVTGTNRSLIENIQLPIYTFMNVYIYLLFLFISLLFDFLCISFYYEKWNNNVLLL